MPLINLVIVLVVVGVVLWVIECSSGYCRYYLAIECFRTHRKPLNDSHWEVKNLRIPSLRRT